MEKENKKDEQGKNVKQDSSFLKGGRKKMAVAYPLQPMRIKRGVERIEQEPTVSEIKSILGLDRLEPIQLTPSDAKDMEDDIDYFKGWYEDELKKYFQDNN